MKCTHLLVTLSLTILVLGGCSSRDPALYKGQIYDRTDSQIRNAIIMAASANNWNICESGDRQFRADLDYKQWKIFADIHYNSNWFTITPNIEFTDLASKKYGTVHRNVNNLIKRFYLSTRSNLSKALPTDPINIPRCQNLHPESQDLDV